ncbi:MAG: hypothetical protein CO098_07790, partial [Bacteroidetes bacterium CG_4_9_14_3_um_filter_41_19]
QQAGSLPLHSNEIERGNKEVINGDLPPLYRLAHGIKAFPYFPLDINLCKLIVRLQIFTIIR